MSYHIQGKRWFQKSYGNTYNSVAIFKNGEEVAYLPMEYGYGDYYLERAEEWLANNGFPELTEKNSNGSRKHGGTIWLRENGISYSVSDVSRQKDL